jgi:hypothetical protein
MKKLIIILLLFPAIIIGQKQNIKENIELNIGNASSDEFGIDYFPGFSIVFVETKQLKNNKVSEWQIGYAFPTFLTGKLGIGFGNLNKNLMVTIRPWPLFFGPQLKLGKMSSSFEVGINGGFIITVGYRWTFKETTMIKISKWVKDKFLFGVKINQLIN